MSIARRTHQVTYKEQNPSFRLMGSPMSAGALFQLLRQSPRRFDIGGLVEYLVSELLHVPKLRSIKMRFSLLNVTSLFNKFGHGYLEAPDQSAWPSSQQLLFTFSLTNLDYDAFTEVMVSYNASVNCKAWGEESMDWCTIGLTGTKCAEFGLSALMRQEVEYLYNIVGTILKNLVKNNMLDLFHRDVNDIHGQHNIKDFAAHLLNMPLLQLMRGVPYPLWIFNRELWLRGPNLFHPMLVTDKVAQYYFTNLTAATNKLVPSDAAFKNVFGLGTNGRMGISRILVDSLLSFVQAVKEGELRIDEDSDVLVPLILESMIERGNNRIVTTIGKSDQGVQQIVDMFNENMMQWTDLFSQPVAVAEKLIRNDQNFANSLLGQINFDSNNNDDNGE